MKPFLAMAAVSACFSSLAFAQTERDLESHVHGSASLNVVLAGSSMFIELSTPWNNMVGFEHAPTTDEQHALVDGSLELLNNPLTLMTLNGGDCTVGDVTVDSAMQEGDHSDEHDEDHDQAETEEHNDAHDDEAHDEHSDEETHDEHSDEEAHDEHSDVEHSTAMATYSFRCENIDRLESIDLKLFSIWSGFEELDVQLVGENGQSLVELDPQNSVLDITQVR